MGMKTLRVQSNPWAAIDAQARPCGVVIREQADNDATGIKYIGAKLTATEVAPKKWRKVGTAVETIQEARFDRSWTFIDGPVEVPAPGGKLTGYYSDRIKRNELLAYDVECARGAGVAFREPKVVIAESMAARKSEFDAQHGDGAFDELQPKPSKAEPQKVTADAPKSAKPKS